MIGVSRQVVKQIGYRVVQVSVGGKEYANSVPHTKDKKEIKKKASTKVDAVTIMTGILKIK